VLGRRAPQQLLSPPRRPLGHRVGAPADARRVGGLDRTVRERILDVADGTRCSWAASGVRARGRDRGDPGLDQGCSPRDRPPGHRRGPRRRRRLSGCRSRPAWSAGSWSRT
jgi:hypothetical protein